MYGLCIIDIKHGYLVRNMKKGIKPIQTYIYIYVYMVPAVSFHLFHNAKASYNV